MNETIINGIDVSECSNFKAGICSKRICELSVNENCLFKRFKRLQEENESLKSLNDFNVQKIEVLKEENEKLYKALEEIRNEIGDLKNINRLINLQKILDTINEVLNDN